MSFGIFIGKRPNTDDLELPAAQAMSLVEPFRIPDSRPAEGYARWQGTRKSSTVDSAAQPEGWGQFAFGVQVRQWVSKWDSNAEFPRCPARCASEIPIGRWIQCRN